MGIRVLVSYPTRASSALPSHDTIRTYCVGEMRFTALDGSGARHN